MMKIIEETEMTALDDLNERYHNLMTEVAMRARHMSETQQEINALVKEMSELEAEIEFLEAGGVIN